MRKILTTIVVTMLAAVCAVAQKDTPVPGGKKPFFINHYGCPTFYYMTNPDDYQEPYNILAQADSQGKLTKFGRDILHRLDLLRQNADHQEGEMTEKGGQLIREQIRQMAKRFPTMFGDNSYIDIRSIMERHSIQMANEVAVEMSRQCRSNRISVKSSQRNMNWLNPQDEELLAQRTDSLTTARYTRFAALNTNYTRLAKQLFNDQNYVASNVNMITLDKQLYALSENIQHVGLAGSITLDDLFTKEEAHNHWRRQNAWNYISYGSCTLNGGYQAYMQREPLWNMLHMGDSIIKLDFPVFNLRYTNEGVLLSLASLMELDNCGVATDNLDSLEVLGWADKRIAPPGGCIVMIHYRRDQNDEDPLIKVLLNGHEALLPFKSDCAPYYHWNDVKRYYLRKLYRYEKKRQGKK